MRRNQERDQAVWQKLEAKGWAVIIVWECQLKKAESDNTVNRVEEVIHRNGMLFCHKQEERRKARIVYREERRQMLKHSLLLK